LHATALLPAKKPGLWLHDVTPALQLVKTFHRFAKILFRRGAAVLSRSNGRLLSNSKTNLRAKTSLHSGRKSVSAATNSIYRCG